MLLYQVDINFKAKLRKKNHEEFLAVGFAKPFSD